MRSSTPDLNGSGRSRVMTGRTNLDGPIQSARSMYFGETPRSEGGGGGPLFSPIGPNRSPERRSSSSARLSRNGSDVLSRRKDRPSTTGSARPETLSPMSPDALSLTTKDYQLGFQEGMRQSLNRPLLEQSRSARERIKKQNARNVQAQKIQQRNEQHLNKFIKRNAEQMWEFVPSLYHTQRDEHHHLSADQWMVDKVNGYCKTAYGGDLAAMLHSFENKEVVEKLRGSHNMRRILLPTVRMDVPESQKKDLKSPYACGYNTNRKNHEMTMTRAFGNFTESQSLTTSLQQSHLAPKTLTSVPLFKQGGPFASQKPLNIS